MGSRSLGEAMEVISPDAVLLVRAPCKKERLELFNEDEHMLGSYSHRKGGVVDR
jgi:SpoU rRNA methylase family enzyme